MANFLTRQPQPVLVWGAQLAGTVGIAVALYLFFGQGAPVFKAIDPEWTKFGLYGILAAGIPAIWYVRRFKRALNADMAAVARQGGVPDPRLRQELMRKMSVGGALCELPLALGALYLMAGGESRWFVGAAAVSIALRLSYRPFTAAKR
jgi:hypothetical protein